MNEFKDRPIIIRQEKDLNPENIDRVFQHYDEIIRNLWSDKLQLDENGDLVIPDATIYAAPESLYLGDTKLSAPGSNDDEKILVFDKENKEYKYDTVLAVVSSILSYLIPGIQASLNHDSINGALMDIAIKNADFFASFNFIYECTGTITATLPNITDPDDVGKKLTILNVGTGVVTIDGAGTDTVHGELTQSAYEGETIDLIATSSTTWRVT